MVCLRLGAMPPDTDHYESSITLSSTCIGLPGKPRLSYDEITAPCSWGPLHDGLVIDQCLIHMSYILACSPLFSNVVIAMSDGSIAFRNPVLKQHLMTHLSHAWISRLAVVRQGATELLHSFAIRHGPSTRSAIQLAKQRTAVSGGHTWATNTP